MHILSQQIRVATVPTVYGIETAPLALKPLTGLRVGLQQYLPFTVLKPECGIDFFTDKRFHYVATVPTVYGIETS